MDRKRLPKGIRRHIRKEKARLRREFLDLDKRNKLLKEVYRRLNIKKDDFGN